MEQEDYQSPPNDAPKAPPAKTPPPTDDAPPTRVRQPKKKLNPAES